MGKMTTKNFDSLEIFPSRRDSECHYLRSKINELFEGCVIVNFLLADGKFPFVDITFDVMSEIFKLAIKKGLKLLGVLNRIELTLKL